MIPAQAAAVVGWKLSHLQGQGGPLGVASGSASGLKQGLLCFLRLSEVFEGVQKAIFLSPPKSGCSGWEEKWQMGAKMPRRLLRTNNFV